MRRESVERAPHLALSCAGASRVRRACGACHVRGMSVASARFFFSVVAHVLHPCCIRLACMLHAWTLVLHARGANMHRSPVCQALHLCCISAPQMLHTCCIHVAYMLHACCIHVAYMLHICCIYVAATLAIRCMCEYVACVLQLWCRVHCMSYKMRACQHIYRVIHAAHLFAYLWTGLWPR